MLCAMTEAAQTGRRRGQAVVGIVDDEESVCLSLATWLRSVGIDSHAFTSGPDLLRSELLAHFSCLLIDQRMPRMTGLETLHALRQRGCEAPVIIISASDALETSQRSAAAGAFAFVDKRFADLSSLREVVLDALEAGHGGPAQPES